MKKNRTKRNKVKNYPPYQVVGLLADIDETEAQGFFHALQREHFTQANCVFAPKTKLCPGCLQTFIVGNSITTLFVDTRLEFDGMGSIGAMNECEIYIVAHDETK